MTSVLDRSTLLQGSVGRASLAGLGREGLRAALAAIGVPDKHLKMRAGQLWSWIYVRGATAFEAMSDVSKELRLALASTYSLERPEIVAEQLSGDGTRKWLLRLPKRGHEMRPPEIETVYIPEAERGTLCISSQVGCTLTCSFCHTGTQRLVRNLVPAEIVGQVLLARDRIGDWPGGASPNDGGLLPAAERKITNVVLMGMGEPLANFRNVVPALSIFLDDFGFDLSRRRVTLSTSGLVPQIYRLAETTNVALAVSLHAPDDALRSELVPINRKHPIAELLQACWHYLDEQNGRSVTFEYVMLDGVNDSPAQARALARLLRGHPAKVNLIPFNPFPGAQYRRSPAPVIQRFRDELLQRGVLATIRRTRGEDIDAACGQLAGRVVDRTTVRLGNKVIGVAVQP